MDRGILVVCLMSAMASVVCFGQEGSDASGLRLVPYPKEVKVTAGEFRLDHPLVFSVNENPLWLLGPMLRDEFASAGLPQPALQPLKGRYHYLTLCPPGVSPELPELPSTHKSGEAYVLSIGPDAVTAVAREAAGLFYAAQTLCQLVRANSAGNRLRCMGIADWPSPMRWRGFQDDLTRIPSSTFEQLQREVATGAFLKLNLFTYYMESQYEFRKHPVIGPPNGSLKPGELKTLVETAAAYHVNILGNQQSFAHFENILCHEEYKALAETPGILTPAKEESYDLLSDLYSEVVPLVPFEYFNVCCDETDGLGQGPAKELVDKQGVGAVYARHIRRIHDILKKRRHKKMMMWGDILLRHPEQIPTLPKDIVILSWGYEPQESFEGHIAPFVKAGFQFCVCPSVRNYGRILPDFRGSTINIRNFVRDGIRNNALGLINTAWDDGGRTLNAPNWYGFAWGAECAWNASITEPAAFNRRVGAVLFGEQGDQFGQAIEILSRIEDLPRYRGHADDRFWKDPLSGEVDMREQAAVHAETNQLLEIATGAREHLLTCQKDAKVNIDLLDYYLFGVDRYRQMAQATLNLMEAVSAYEEALRAAQAKAEAFVEKAESLLRDTANGYRVLQAKEWDLYLRENKPYGADFRPRMYQSKFIDKYEGIAARLRAIREDLAKKKPLPAAKDVGLALEGVPR